MLRFAWLALVAGSLLPLAATAQTSPATQQGFAFCTVTDTGSAQAKIWASPIVPVAYAASDSGGFKRSLALASEFHAHVGTLGGAGDKQCVLQASQSEAAASREEQRAIWDKRVYFIKIGDWREVAWTPAPWNPAADAALAHTQLTKYFYCYNTQTDVPDRSDLARTVASRVFAMPVPGDDPGAVYTQANAYAEEFKQTIRAHGLPDEGTLCIPHDTQGEADKTSRDYRKLFGGFNTKFTEVTWMPTGKAAASTPATTGNAVIAAPANAPMAPAKGIGVRINTVGAELAQALGLASPQGAWVVEVVEGGGAMKAGIKPMDVLLEIAGQAVNSPGDVPIIIGRLQPGFQAPVRLWRERQMQTVTLTIPDQPVNTASYSTPPSATPATAATDYAPDGGQYCAAFVLHSKSALVLRTPIWELPAGQASNAAMSDSLSRLAAAAVRANPGSRWMTFPPVLCYDNAAAYAGETFCVSNTYKHFGGSQMAGQFCNRSKTQLEKRWAEMTRSDGPDVRRFPWPVTP